MKWGRPEMLRVSYILTTLALLAATALAGAKWG